MTDINIEFIREQLQIAEDAINKAQNALPPPPPSGIVIKPGDDIQSIIDSADPGDVLEFIPGETYITGQLYLSSKPITLKSQDDLPSRRINLTDELPILKSGGPFCTIDGSNASELIIMGLHFDARDSGEGDVIILENANSVIMDRIRIRGNSVNGCKRGIRGNGTNITLQRSYLENIWKFQQDSQCFCAWNGAGPFNILDNYLEGAAENILFGGADNQSEANIPSNILIENNDITKRAEWKGVPNKYSVKNLFELKMAKHVVVRGNRFSKCWTDAQAGFAIVLKSANQDGSNPWAVTEDVVFEYNSIKETENGINMLGYDPYNSSQQTTGLVFLHNTIECSGIALQLLGQLGTCYIERDTFKNGYTFMVLDAAEGKKAVDKLTLIGTEGNHNQYGVKGSGSASGNPSLTKWVGELVWQNNVLNDYVGKGSYPPTTYNSMADVPSGIDVGA